MSAFSPEQLQQIQALIQSGQISLGADGRSPLRPRQLSDLRLVPTATDPRPLFIPSAEAPRDWDVTATHPYPRLLWTQDGIEVTVHGSLEHQRLVSEGYLEVAPHTIVIDPVAAVQDELAGLTEDDRTMVLEAQRQSRLQRLQDKLANLSDADLETALNRSLAQAAVKPKKKAGAA